MFVKLSNFSSSRAATVLLFVVKDWMKSSMLTSLARTYKLCGDKQSWFAGASVSLQHYKGLKEVSLQKGILLLLVIEGLILSTVLDSTEMVDIFSVYKWH